MERIKKIFVPTDFSACSNEALAYAAFLAKQLSATILLTHFTEPYIPTFTEPYIYTLTSPHPFDDMEMRAGQALDRMAHPWRESGIYVETHLLRGNPGKDIGKAAKVLECDLIVMGTHGRTGVSHFMMGSVAEHVIRTAPLPVLTVRLRGEVKANGNEREADRALRFALDH